jgi:glycosyltransferase involved in cell wall biosynthesis
VPNTVESLGLEDDVVFTGYVEEDSTIGKLFSAADCSIFPTLHETFGMPVLESMAAGCPIVTSNTTVIPEVAGDAGILVDDPTDPSAVGDAVISVLENKDYCQSLSKRGRSRAEEFQWETCAEEFLELFDEIERE